MMKMRTRAILDDIKKISRRGGGIDEAIASRVFKFEQKRLFCIVGRNVIRGRWVGGHDNRYTQAVGL